MQVWRDPRPVLKKYDIMFFNILLLFPSASFSWGKKSVESEHSKISDRISDSFAHVSLKMHDCSKGGRGMKANVIPYFKFTLHYRISQFLYVPTTISRFSIIYPEFWKNLFEYKISPFPPPLPSSHACPLLLCQQV